MMIDLHSHTTLSDGDLIPAELVRRAQVKGIEALALTDHVDTATAEWVVPLLVRAAEDLNKVLDDITVIPGAEVTHVPPTLIAELIERCRALGAGIVLVHGETIVEPVAPGTDRAGIEGGADVIAHPGLVSDADAALAAKEGVALEISARVGHSLTNGHVAKVARKNGAKLVFGSDTHEPEDIPTPEFAEKVLRAAGLDADALSEAAEGAKQLVRRYCCA